MSYTLYVFFSRSTRKRVGAHSDEYLIEFSRPLARARACLIRPHAALAGCCNARRISHLPSANYALCVCVCVEVVAGDGDMQNTCTCFSDTRAHTHKYDTQV